MLAQAPWLMGAFGVSRMQMGMDRAPARSPVRAWPLLKFLPTPKCVPDTSEAELGPSGITPPDECFVQILGNKEGKYGCRCLARKTQGDLGFKEVIG